ncbi:MAG: hypothetical protein Unbinned3891contig1000_88 [Prokaryotic dsDNA virus sp.]|nr:MAG: hypothetical protein Unbinned3891contig1000_88 [Prokaryotic dsDNA virus sp.]|tara:strand:- start:42089 stop:42520 length:432 start_codon:yes stop_codon:yes gene_type:complete
MSKENENEESEVQDKKPFIPPAVIDFGDDDYTLPLNNLPGYDDPVEVCIRSISAAERDTYMNGEIKRMRVGKDGKTTGVKFFDRIQSNLIALCVTRTSDNKRFPQSEIDQWKSSAVKKLYDLCRWVNNLDDETDQLEEEAKNE